jgi:hypothetical protein
MYIIKNYSRWTTQYLQILDVLNLLQQSVGWQTVPDLTLKISDIFPT